MKVLVIEGHERYAEADAALARGCEVVILVPEGGPRSSSCELVVKTAETMRTVLTFLGLAPGFSRSEADHPCLQVPYSVGYVVSTLWSLGVQLGSFWSEGSDQWPFAAAISALRASRPFQAAAAEVVLAPDWVAALRLALGLAYERYNPKSGWSCHQATVARIPTELF